MINLNKPLVFGIDISDYNTVDWQTLKNGPIKYVFIKSSEGKGPKTFADKAAAHVAGAQSIGMPYSFYHFARADYDHGDALKKARDEATFFWQRINELGGMSKLSFPPVLDYEKPASGGVSNEQWVNAFVDQFLKLSGGVLPILYASKGQWTGYGLTNYKYSGDFWVAQGLVNDPAYAKKTDVGIQWGLKPPRNGVIDPWPNIDTTIWQYSWKGKIPGTSIPGSSDQDVNVMTQEQFDSYLSSGGGGGGGGGGGQVFTAGVIGAVVLAYLLRQK